jgi:hypothetical protein
MQLCLPLMKNIVPKVDVIGKCYDRMFINWAMWWTNERKTMIMCICLPMDSWNALDEMIDKGKIMKRKMKRDTSQCKKQKWKKCSKMLVAPSSYNLSHIRWALKSGFSLLEWTSTHQHTIHKCMWWFDCGWTSPKLIYGFTLVTHSIRNKSYTRDKCQVTPFSALLSSPNSFSISKHCYLQSNEILLNMSIKC